MYDLPEERIAKFPLKDRDESKLLTYTEGRISHSAFREVARFIPHDSLVVWNDTKVVQARLHFRKPTGALVEVFLLEPHDPDDHVMNFASEQSCLWRTMIGNRKKWKDGLLSSVLQVQGGTVELSAELTGNDQDDAIVKFSWKPGSHTFGEVLDIFGKTPLPPYLKRESVMEDKRRYQTIYAAFEGSVAAPTAGLHFTPELIKVLGNQGIKIESLTLHVSAGTFVPVKSADIARHRMHAEQVIIHRGLIQELVNGRHKDVTAIGTTTLRSLESLYWLGRRFILDDTAGSRLPAVGQWEPYESGSMPEARECLEAVLGHLSRKGFEEIRFETRLMIVPGYPFKMVNRLITNFHQPGSTLLLLVAAFTGNRWKEIYQYALENGFRFLSYGDSSLLER